MIRLDELRPSARSDGSCTSNSNDSVVQGELQPSPSVRVATSKGEEQWVTAREKSGGEIAEETYSGRSFSGAVRLNAVTASLRHATLDP